MKLNMFKIDAGSIRRFMSSRIVLRILFYIWVAFPYPIRKPLTALFILWTLVIKKVAGINRNDKPTPINTMGNLSFWGVPEIEIETYTLEITGEVSRSLRYTFEELVGMDSVEKPIRMDCVGGFRNNSVMRGVPLANLFEIAQLRPEAESAVFRCADGYYTAHLVRDILESNAMMVYEINGERIEKFGFPLRLAAPGTYGYKWPKWVTKIELVRGHPKGLWEEKGLPKRGRVGDIW